MATGPLKRKAFPRHHAESSHPHRILTADFKDVPEFSDSQESLVKERGTRKTIGLRVKFRKQIQHDPNMSTLYTCAFFHLQRCCVDGLLGSEAEG